MTDSAETEIFHPIRILARPDGELTTVFHSLVVCSIDKASGMVDIVAKHPPYRKNIETVEDGIRAIIMDHVAETPDFKDNDSTCTFVLTNHDGRLYVYASISKCKVVAAVCSLPLFSFCRRVFEKVGEESLESMLPIVYTLCEMPLFPMPNLRYDFQFQTGTLNMQFDALDSIRDQEVHALVVSAMSPQMIVRAWEALIVERRILVTSSYPALLLPCCELVRKLIHPLPFMGAFIPELPASGVEAVEAPGTFIIGVETNTLRKSSVDLNGIVILDLDRRQVIFTPSPDDDPYYAAPPAIINSLLQNINSIMNEPATRWYNRSIHTNDNNHPFLNGGTSVVLNNICRLFVKLNVSILSAQFCRTKAFYRSSVNKDDSSGFYTVLGTTYRAESSIPIGYSDQFGYKVGCVQLWKANENKEDTIHHTIPCWMEMNDFALSVYEQADDLPLLFIPIVEFDAVESCALEPEGHVFQLSLKNSLVFRFTAADPESRQAWLTAIEQKINLAQQNTEKKVFSVTTAERQQALDFPLPIDKSLLGATAPAGSATPFANNSNNNNNNNGEGFFGNRFPTANIGLQPVADFVPPAMAQHYHDFRHLIQSTQMVLSLYSLTECAAFDSVFPERSDSLAQYVTKEHSFEMKISKYLGTLHRAVDVVDKITKATDDGGDEFNLEYRQSILGSNNDDEAAFADARLTQSLYADKSLLSTASISAKPQQSTDRPTFLQRFFSRRRSDESSKEDQRQELEREVEQRNQQFLLERIQDTKTMYNRCLAELSYLIVEDRIQFLRELHDATTSQNPPWIELPVSEIGQEVLTHIQSKLSRGVATAATPTPTANPTASAANTPDPRQRYSTNLTWDLHARLYEGLSANHIALIRRKAFVDENGPASAGMTRHNSRKFPLGSVSSSFMDNGTSTAAPTTVANALASLSVKDTLLSDGELTPTSESEKVPGSSSSKDIENSMNLSSVSEDDDVYVDVEATDILANDQATNYNDYLNQLQHLVKLEVEKYLKCLLDSTAPPTKSTNEPRHDSTSSATEETTVGSPPTGASEKSVSFVVDAPLDGREHSSTASSTTGHVYAATASSAVRPIVHSLHGYCLQNLDCYEEALADYSVYSLIDPTRTTFCLLQLFLNEAEHESFARTFSEPAFIARANKIGGKVLGLHAYRLILELIHAELKKQVVAKKNIYWNSPKLSLGDFRVYPRTESALRNQENLMA